jgi:hypothetical protein
MLPTVFRYLIGPTFGRVIWVVVGTVFALVFKNFWVLLPVIALALLMKLKRPRAAEDKKSG